MKLSEKQAALCTENETDFSDLRAVFFNCTLKNPDQASHTSLLMGSAAEIMRKSGVTVEDIRMTAYKIAPGVQPDMREHGWDYDDWPDMWHKVEAADILVIGTPIWLGEQSSVCRVLIERLYAISGLLNDKGQSIFYGKTGDILGRASPHDPVDTPHSVPRPTTPHIKRSCNSPRCCSGRPLLRHL